MDEKGRVAFPSAFRVDFGLTSVDADALGRFRLTQEPFARCLVARTEAAFDELLKKVQAMPRSHPLTLHYRRFVVGGAHEIIVDRAGRVNIPRELRDYAGLGRDVVWVGELDTIELWSRERLDETRREVDALDPQDIQRLQREFDL
jgi:MraZ protein